MRPLHVLCSQYSSHDLILQRSKQGILHDQQNAYNIVSNGAKYVVTSMKLINQMGREFGNPRPGIIPHLEKFFTEQQAHLCYLQDELTSLIVQGNFNADTARVGFTAALNLVSAWQCL